ncbi:hypothetical protein ALC62_02129 [Cyphomyrmex costatus]|uniref:Uncharacterized protein n=1 Tax=Cyphomyrmex costatus TaxID=456900 RepID=A0A195D3E6_9HYME|nr:hypothetical protein ALC62_02129 [Cyphomyrmex costatus]
MSKVVFKRRRHPAIGTKYFRSPVRYVCLFESTSSYPAAVSSTLFAEREREREIRGMKGQAREREERKKRVYRGVKRDGGRCERRARAGMRRDGRRWCMRKNFTREPANPRERFTSSARLPAASVSCAIPYAALGEATTVPGHDSRHVLVDRSVTDRTRLGHFEIPGIARFCGPSYDGARRLVSRQESATIERKIKL